MDVDISNRTIARALIAPYGGALVDLMASPDEAAELEAHASRLPSLQLSDRAVCDLELLATGAFSPLNRFMGKADYESVVARSRLADGSIFPIPVTLTAEHRALVGLDREMALRDSKNDLLAVMRIEEIYQWSRVELARQVLGTIDEAHPLVAETQRWGPVNVSGSLRMLRLPLRYDFRELRLSPAQTRQRLMAYGRPNVVAFQTRNPLHRAHEELTRRAIRQVDGVLLLHPAVGTTRPGDVDHFTRVRTYKALTRVYSPDPILLSLLPLAMWMAGPREALWHAVIRRNYGANYLIVGRDHASPGLDSSGRPFYGRYDAQEMVERHSSELGVIGIPFREFVYVPDEEAYREVSEVPPQTRTLAISGTQIREDFLEHGRPLPAWFTRPEIAQILQQSYRPRHRQGVCIWFTGLSASGKSTTAEILAGALAENGRPVTVLDGDVVRTHLSLGLGFSREDRDINIRRIGFVAAEIARHGGTAICAAVSPFRATRDEVRNMVGSERFVEVFVDTPLQVCEARDKKGMYLKARRGEISDFTGIDHPYEPPLHAELTLDSVTRTAEENVRLIFDYLAARGFLWRGRAAPAQGDDFQP